MSTIGDVFPHNDPVARFVVAMGIARNDVEHALHLAVRANEGEDSSFHYHVRVTTGHTVEAARALGRWRQVPEVRQFLAKLPNSASEELKSVAGMVDRIGSSVAEHARDRTFHYPYPTTRYTPDPDQELAHVLEALAAEDANLVITQTDPLRVRFEFSDRAALMLSLQKHDPDEAKLREQLRHARDGGIAFVRFVDELWAVYRNDRELSYD